MEEVLECVRGKVERPGTVQAGDKKALGVFTNVAKYLQGGCKEDKPGSFHDV